MSKTTSSKARSAKSRFRSPDTLTRAQWDSSREQLGDKIDEVMASFREDKLSVKPRTRLDSKLPALLSNAHARARYKSANFSWLAGVIALAVITTVAWLAIQGDSKKPSATTTQSATPEASGSTSTPSSALDPTAARTQ